MLGISINNNTIVLTSLNLLNNLKLSSYFNNVLDNVLKTKYTLTFLTDKHLMTQIVTIHLYLSILIMLLRSRIS